MKGSDKICFPAQGILFFYMQYCMESTLGCKNRINLMKHVLTRLNLMHLRSDKVLFLITRGTVVLVLIRFRLHLCVFINFVVDKIAELRNSVRLWETVRYFSSSNSRVLISFAFHHSVLFIILCFTSSPTDIHNTAAYYSPGKLHFSQVTYCI